MLLPRDKRELARALGETLRADVHPLNYTHFHTPNLFGLWVGPGFYAPGHYSAGRALETDALLGSVIELARLRYTPVPTLEAVPALTMLLGRPLQAGA